MLFSSKPLFDRLYRVSALKWQCALERMQVLKSLLMKVVLLTSDRLSKEDCIAAHLFSKEVLRLVRKSGLLFTALYLKQCSACLQTAYGGVRRSPDLLPVPVSLNRSGYPRIIPSFHRLIIMRKDARSDRLVRLYLSFFTISKIIKLAKKISYKSTFKSIVAPTDLDSASIWCGELRDKLSALTARYLPFVSSIPLHQGISWQPTFKSLPTHWRVNELFRHVLIKEVGKPRVVSCFPALLFELNGFSFLLERVHVSEDHFSQGILWPHFIRYAGDPGNVNITNWCLNLFDSVIGPKLPSYRELQEPPVCGRLGQSVEGGGKRRIFAIGNYVNQRLLHPVHCWLMAVLRRLPTDGTFNQEAPLDRLVGEMVCYSFDLSSATDRFPLQVLFEVMQHLFDRSFASSIRSALALNIFDVPFVKRPRSTVSFVSGQPLGYYSSWPLFSLAHHYLVWWCAEQVYPGSKFAKYAILGDDVVIADREVAMVYEQTLGRLSVSISYQKSLISDTGAAEFAKRLRVRGLTVDLSPVSVRALLNFFHPFGLLAVGLKYHCKRFSNLARIGGAGFRQLARIDHSPSVRVARLRSMYTKALLGLGHIELWLGRGRILNPSLRASLIHLVLKRLKPKELRIAPVEVYVTEKVSDLSEYTTLRGWVKQYLRYLQWYCQVALDPWVKLDSLFDGPVYASNWYSTKQDTEIVRFGVLWELYDLVTVRGVDWSVPILPVTPPGGQPPVWLLGGSCGTCFLVHPRGLVQPRAGMGVVVPGVDVNSSSGVDPRMTLIHYKTLGVSDRQSVLDFERFRSPD